MKQKIQRRPPIKGQFSILVVPRDDTQLVESPLAAEMGIEIPRKIWPRERHFRVAAWSPMKGNFEVSAWAFTDAKRDEIVARLRELADFIEQNPVMDV